jgi:small redox-active disulfide protein 2
MQKTGGTDRTSRPGIGLEYELVKVTEINDIMDFGVMMTPALAVNGKVKVAGKIPSVEEIKSWISE